MSDYFRVTTKEEVLELLAYLPEFLDENGFSEEEKQNCIANYTRLAEISPTKKELLESEWYTDMMERGGVVDTQDIADEWKFKGGVKYGDDISRYIRLGRRGGLQI